VLTAGMRPTPKIAQKPALADYSAEEILSRANVRTDAGFEGSIRANSKSNLHPVAAAATEGRGCAV